MSRKPNKVIIKKSSKAGKKLDATFSYPDTTRTKTISFGQAGAPDYTLTKDKEQRKRYIARHRARENWNKPDSAGALSRWILWNKETKASSINNYKSKFNLK